MHVRHFARAAAEHWAIHGMLPFALLPPLAATVGQYWNIPAADVRRLADHSAVPSSTVSLAALAVIAA